MGNDDLVAGRTGTSLLCSKLQLTGLITTYICPSDQTTGPFAIAIDAVGDPLPITDAAGNPLPTAGNVLATPSSYAGSVGGDETETATGINDDGLGLGKGIFFRNSRIRMADITDGTSQTIAVVERAWANAQGLWAGAITKGVVRRGPNNRCPIPPPPAPAQTEPAATLVLAHCHLLNTISDPDAGLDDCSSNHPGGANFLFADGSIHFLKSIPTDAGTLPNGNPIYSPAGLVFQALATRAGGEVLSADSY
jgi:prepilin-type processing-associated H-X9-DG protein